MRQIDLETLKRIAIIGSTGSGKTTLGRALAGILNVPHIELDAIFWRPNWTPIDINDFRRIAEEKTSPDAWITDGNYGRVRPVIWKRATAILWLNYPLPLMMWWLLKRSLKRIVLRKKLWNNNYETLKSQFLSKDSLFLWLFKTYKGYRTEFPLQFVQPEYRHLKVFEFKNPRETEQFLHQVRRLLYI